jgi:plasmid stabilization system protein ParE
MKAKLLWSPQAREDLLNIYLTIGLDNPNAAERFVNLIEAQAALLADQPRLGPRRPEINPHFSHSLRSALLFRRARCQEDAEKRIGQYG